MRSLALPCLAAFMTAGLFAPPVPAATVDRYELYMSSSRCQPALPAFDGAIRKRPLAMQNEGTGPAFITCGLDGLAFGVRSKAEIAVGLINTSGAPVTISCTLVDGQAGLINPVQFTKSVLVGSGSNGEIVFDSGMNGGNKFMYPATSCSLPAGTGIRFVGAQYSEDVGN